MPLLRPRLARLSRIQPAEMSRSGHAAQGWSPMQLRRAILEGVATPGSVLTGDEVAESMQSLVGDGLIERIPDIGYAVTTMSSGEAREMHSVRETLEIAVLSAAATRADSEDHRHIAEAHERLDRSARMTDTAAHRREHRRFYRALVAPSGMHRMNHLLESAWNLTELGWPAGRISAQQRAELLDDHRRQLEAFLARDVAELLMVTEQHHARLIGLLPRAPEAIDIS